MYWSGGGDVEALESWWSTCGDILLLTSFWGGNSIDLLGPQKTWPSRAWQTVMPSGTESSSISSFDISSCLLRIASSCSLNTLCSSLNFSWRIFSWINCCSRRSKVSSCFSSNCFSCRTCLSLSCCRVRMSSSCFARFSLSASICRNMSSCLLINISSWLIRFNFSCLIFASSRLCSSRSFSCFTNLSLITFSCGLKSLSIELPNETCCCWICCCCSSSCCCWSRCRSRVVRCSSCKAAIFLASISNLWRLYSAFFSACNFSCLRRSSSSLICSSLICSSCRRRSSSKRLCSSWICLSLSISSRRISSLSFSCRNCSSRNLSKFSCSTFTCWRLCSSHICSIRSCSSRSALPSETGAAATTGALTSLNGAKDWYFPEAWDGWTAAGAGWDACAATAPGTNCLGWKFVGGGAFGLLTISGTGKTSVGTPTIFLCGDSLFCSTSSLSNWPFSKPFPLLVVLTFKFWLLLTAGLWLKTGCVTTLLGGGSFFSMSILMRSFCKRSSSFFSSSCLFFSLAYMLAKRSCSVLTRSSSLDFLTLLMIFMYSW